MSVSYEELEAAELGKVAAEQSGYAAGRRRTLADQLAQLNAGTVKTIAAQKSETTRKIKQNRAKYTDQYRQNAVQQAVDRRRWRQKLIDTGLLHSGFARAGQTAVAAQKAAADSRTAALAKADVDQLMSALAQKLASIQASAGDKAASLTAGVERDIAANEQSLRRAAKSRAQSRYKAQLSADTARYKADTTAATARYKADTAAKTAQYKAKVAAEAKMPVQRR